MPKVINKSLKILKKLKKRYEIIIIDDCCPEKSGLVAVKHSKKNKKIKAMRIRANNIGKFDGISVCAKARI